MTITNKQIDTGTRLGTMILDHFIMTMIMMVFFIPGMISNFANAFKTTHEQTSFDPFGGNLIYLGLFGFVVYFCKDIINGRSFAKRMLKLQLVNNSTGKVASPIRCFVRNVFCIIWPVEVIISMITPSRRLGDRVAGTKLVVYDPSNEQPKVNFGKLLIPLALAYGTMLLFMIPIKAITSTMDGQKVKFIETSYNKQSSKELEKLLTDSLGQYFTPNIRVYDKIQNQDLKYISTILHLKENFLEDEEQSSRLDSNVNELIYSKFSEKAFTGNLKYVFEASGQMQTSTHHIGTRLITKSDK